MYDFSEASIKTLIVHKVGNKTKIEPILISRNLYSLDNSDLEQILLKYFTYSFKNQTYYNFTHQTDLLLNEIYTFAKQIFNDNSSFLLQTVNIAKHLYEKSIHPKIKGGELYICIFDNCNIDNIKTQAIGIFKSENKDTFLKTYENNDEIVLNSEEGINIKNLDKGCIIFNSYAEEGYKIIVVDSISDETKYWIDDFLKVVEEQNYRFKTKAYLSLCRDFCKEISNITNDKKKEVVLLNKSVSYFAKHESFDTDDFIGEVIEEPDVAKSFKNFKDKYVSDRELENLDSFEISKPVIKQMKNKLKNSLKLDTGVEIIFDSDKSTDLDKYITKGFDEEFKMNYYLIYFNKELNN